MNARPITWPTVPKGKDRVRVCLHAGNTEEELDKLIQGIISWARETIVEKEKEKEGESLLLSMSSSRMGQVGFLESKL